MEAATDFIFSGPKITVDGDCTHEIKKHLLLGREDMINLDKKQRHHFAEKSSYSQSYSFPGVMYRCEGRTMKKAEHCRTDAFELCCWRRLLRVPWTSKRRNQSILKEITMEYSLERLMLKFQYSGHLIWRANSLEKTLMLGKVEGRRKRGWQRMKWLDGIIEPMDMSLRNIQEMVKDREAWRGTVHGIRESDMT